MINPQWLELPISRTIFYGPKDVRAIEFRLYIGNTTIFCAGTVKCCPLPRYMHCRATSKFYRSHSELMSKYNIGLKTFLQEGLFELESFGELVNKFRNIAGKKIFFFWFFFDFFYFFFFFFFFFFIIYFFCFVLFLFVCLLLLFFFFFFFFFFRNNLKSFSPAVKR